ncbi:MAG: AbrB/MazE/SpoVT family DNA-binding domain-containing protein [Terriglobales bacterium]
MAKAKISSKGQVTIPVAIRRWLGVRPGECVEFARKNGEVVVRPAREPAENPFTKYTGMFGDFPGGVEEINAWIRAMRDDDEK